MKHLKTFEDKFKLFEINSYKSHRFAEPEVYSPEKIALFEELLEALGLFPNEGGYLAFKNGTPEFREEVKRESAIRRERFDELKSQMTEEEIQEFFDWKLQKVLDLPREDVDDDAEWNTMAEEDGTYL